MDLEKFTFKLSVLIQLLGIIITPLGLLLPKKKDKIALYECLKLETMVNVIELISYLIILKFIYKVSDVSTMRYYDWFITTPMLLLSVIIYFQYLNGKKNFTIKNVMEEYSNNYGKIIIYNLLMLLSGYLGELKLIPRYLGTIIGFIFFILLFRELKKLTLNNRESETFFTYFMILWSLYGISFNFNSKIKNTGYNILDLFSKTFYGLFILYKYLV